MVIMSTVGFVEAVILIKIDFNKISKKASEMIRFITYQIHKFLNIKFYQNIKLFLLTKNLII